MAYAIWEAKKKAEPEDQDYYGFGARGARWCINLLVGAAKEETETDGLADGQRASPAG